MNSDFQRDLHLRVFNAIASLGFDVVEWLPTADLEFLKTIGDGELAILRNLAAAEKSNKAKQDFGSNRFDDKKLTSLERDIAKLEASMAPYLSKLAERHAKK